MKTVVLVGKVREICQLLKQYGKQFTYVSEWVDYVEASKKHANHQQRSQNFTLRNRR
nr:Z-ring formation inhibitor MciZ [Bacillus kwashiorkori]